MNRQPKFESWKRSLDIANIKYNENDFYDNVAKMSANCVTKYSKEFYIERYSCIFSEKVIDMIYKINVDHILKNRKNPYDAASVARSKNIPIEDAQKIVEQRKGNTSGSLANFIRRHGEEEGKKKYQEFCKKSAQSLEKFIKKYGEEGRQKYQDYLKSKSSSFEMNIKRYGEEEGRKRFNEATHKRKYNSSLAGQIEKYGVKEGTKRYNNSCKRKAVTRESLISKYGEVEGKKKYQESCLKRSKGNTIHGFIEKYGKERGETLYKKSCMMRSPIYAELRKLYNETTATKLYLSGKSKKYKKAKETVKKRMQSVYTRSSTGPTSKQSTMFFEKLEKYIDIALNYGRKKQELRLFNEEIMKLFFYDAYNEEEKIIIEYHGVAHHPKEDEHNWVGPYGHSYQEVRQRDAIKKQTAVNAGYLYIEVWSDEPFYQQVEKIKNTLNNRRKI
jgi:hypothetical protein